MRELRIRHSCSHLQLDALFRGLKEACCEARVLVDLQEMESKES